MSPDTLEQRILEALKKQVLEEPDLIEVGYLAPRIARALEAAATLCYACSEDRIDAFIAALSEDR